MKIPANPLEPRLLERVEGEIQSLRTQLALQRDFIN
jgi:hypothetical protein